MIDSRTGYRTIGLARRDSSGNLWSIAKDDGTGFLYVLCLSGHGCDGPYSDLSAVYEAYKDKVRHST